MNRDDVRLAIGGGGFVVIDSLIRAWRELKPLREVAPNTPAELLHQIAGSLEAHLSGFIEATESHTSESQQVFERTVTELSAQLAALEQTLEERDTALTLAVTENTRLVEESDALKAELTAAKSEAAQQAETIDTLQGRVTRMEKEYAAALKAQQAKQRELVEALERERIQTSKDHASSLEKQRKELIAAVEQAENRLMGLLDQERQGAKALETMLSKALAEKANGLQSARETVVELNARVKSLEKQNTALEKGLDRQTKHAETLQKQLDTAKKASADITREFRDYKAAYQVSSDLGSLKEVVAGLQAQLNAPKATARKRSKKPAT